MNHQLKFFEKHPISSLRNLDIITQYPLADSDEIVDLGILPVPGLFFENAEIAANVKSAVRVIRHRQSGLIQLDHDINPLLYYYYKSGRVDDAHLAHIEKTADALAQAYSRDANILEIGGGAGHLMRALLRRGFYNLKVVDPSAENLPDQGYFGIQGVFPDAVADSNEKFDVIIGQHFLEHSATPVSVLAAAASMLTDRGQLWIEVPDIERSALSDNGSNLSIIYALHSGYYDRHTIKLAGLQAGLTLIRLESIDHYGQSIVAVFSLADGVNNVPLMIKSDNREKVDCAIRHYFNGLAEFGAMLPPGLICWGAAERCLTVLGACIAGGFQPGIICDSNPDLRGLYLSGMSQAVCGPRDFSSPIEAALILSVRHANLIVRENKALFAPNAVVYIPFLGCKKIANWYAA